MAPNKRGGPLSAEAAAAASVLGPGEVAARGRGTAEPEGSDSYDGGLAAEVRVFFTGLMFLTRLPVPSWTDHHPAYLMRSTAYFPLIGAAVGLWGAVFYQAAAALWPPAVGAAASTLATVWLTGCFHEDGLSDCLDGFGGGWGRKQILTIMRDSRVGTYALVGVALLLQIKMAALQATPSPMAALVAAHCASRWSSLPLLFFCRYIEDDEHEKAGMYNVMARSQKLVTWRRLLFGTAVAAAVPVAAVGPARGALVAATVAVVTVAAGYYGNAIIGGVVGDYLGATIQVAELCAYLALSADWAALAAPGGWMPLALLVATVAVPVTWCRQIVDFKC